MRKFTFLLLMMLYSFFLFGCSLSGSVKTAKSQIDESPIVPPSTPVEGTDDFRITQPTEYINNGNTNSYPISGSCKTGDEIVIKINSVVSQTIKCENSQFSTELDLSELTSGYITIVAEVTDGNSTEQTSVQILKDIVSPTLIGNVIDGSYFNSTTQTPTLTWTAGTDAHSGIASYQIAVGTTLGGTDIVSWSNATSAASGQVAGLNLVNGSTYYASVRAIDGAGNTSVVITSDGWVVDANAPTLATNFIDGILNFSVTHSPSIAWTASTDAVSGMSGYQLALGTSSGATNLLDWTNLGNVTSATLNSLNLTGNQRIYSSLRSVDLAGNTTSSVLGDGWWNLRQTKKAIDTTNPETRSLSRQSRFGYSVAISSDELTMAIGAQGEQFDVNGLNYLESAGAVFVFIKSGGSWVLQQKIVATGTNARNANDSFGYKISLSDNSLAVSTVNHGFDQNGANLVSSAGAVFVYTRSGGVWSLQQKIVATGTNARMADDGFGSGLSLEQDTLAVGAQYNSYDANGANSVTNAGAVFVYTRSGSVWSLQQKIVATGTNARMAYDSFGTGLSLEQDTLAVGAQYNSYDANGANSVTNAGAVFVYTRSGSVWSQQQKIVATGTNARMANDYFGSQVSIYQDTLAVTSSQNSYDASGNNFELSGAVFVYTRSGSVWSQQQKLVSSGVNSRVNAEAFGASISLEGDVLLVGATGQQTDENGDNVFGLAGAVYYFTRSGGVWSQQQKIVPSGTNARSDGTEFGHVHFSGSTAVIGAYSDNFNQSGQKYVYQSGSAYVFEFGGSSWSQSSKLVNPTTPQSRQDTRGVRFGKSVAISDDGLTLAISGDDTNENGLDFLSGAGSVFIYSKQAGSWVFQQKIVATGANARLEQSYFGYSISISNDSIAVGAKDHSYDENGDNAATAAGAVFVYIRSAGVWSQQQRIVGTGTNARNADDYFGSSISLYNDTLVVGSPGYDFDANGNNQLDSSGAVFVYTRSGGVWSQQQRIVGSGTNGREDYDSFGSSVSVYLDTLVVGAPYQDYNNVGGSAVSEAGAAYVFFRSGGVWSLQQKVIATGTNARIADDNFGSVVSVYGDTIAIGSQNHDYNQIGETLLSNSGAVFVYTRSGVTWTQEQKLVATGINARNADDSFGFALSLSENTLVVGAPFHNFDSAGENSLDNSGSVFIFTRQAATWTQSLKLTPTGSLSRNESDSFGSNVSLSENNSSDGFSILVGAPSHSYDSNGGSSVFESGATYIFD